MNTNQCFTLKPLEEKQVSHQLLIEVPAFQPGAYPPVEGAFFSILPASAHTADFPYFVKRSLILKLAQDEARYRRTHPKNWRERCWLIIGTLQRAPDGYLWGMIEHTQEVETITASSSFFEFSPEAWRSLKREIGDTEQLLLGWIHTHSVEFLTHAGSIETKDTNAPYAEGSEQSSHRHSNCNVQKMNSGLFLSRVDIESAYKKGFSAPYHLTCILDSDVCNEIGPLEGTNVPFHKTLGLWGWLDVGTLYRRDLYIIRD